MDQPAMTPDQQCDNGGERQPPDAAQPLQPTPSRRPITWRQRLRALAVLLSFFLTFILAFVFWCLGIYAPVFLTNLAIALHPVTGPIVSLLGQPDYLFPPGEWATRLVVEQPGFLDLVAQQDQDLWAMTARLQIDDLVVALDVILWLVQLVVLSIILLFYRDALLPMARRMLHLHMKTKGKKLSRRRLQISGIGTMLGCIGVIIWAFTSGGMLRDTEMLSDHSLRDFPDFLHQTIIYLGFPVLLLGGAALCLLLGFPDDREDLLSRIEPHFSGTGLRDEDSRELPDVP